MYRRSNRRNSFEVSNDEAIGYCLKSVFYISLELSQDGELPGPGEVGSLPTASTFQSPCSQINL